MRLYFKYIHFYRWIEENLPNNEIMFLDSL